MQIVEANHSIRKPALALASLEGRAWYFLRLHDCSLPAEIHDHVPAESRQSDRGKRKTPWRVEQVAAKPRSMARTHSLFTPVSSMTSYMHMTFWCSSFFIIAISRITSSNAVCGENGPREPTNTRSVHPCMLHANMQEPTSERAACPHVAHRYWKLDPGDTDGNETMQRGSRQCEWLRRRHLECPDGGVPELAALQQRLIEYLHLRTHWPLLEQRGAHAGEVESRGGRAAV